ARPFDFRILRDTSRCIAEGKKSNLAVAEANALPALKATQNGVRETRRGETVRQQAHPTGAAGAGKGKRRFEGAGRHVFPGNSHGQCIALALSATERHFDVAEDRIVFGTRQWSSG